ncbi:MAG: orotidine-5'-phosphate decarboxylase [Dehalococcoidia bacterium]|nr:orotidine-5'-phosphate decarboxylase [Dehalococcoidia bacterium]
MNFIDKLLAASRKNKSLLCIGLDPNPELMPSINVADFNRDIINATCDLACAYKPNLAFYEAQGLQGLIALEKTIKFIPPHIPIIGDAKRGDIGNTSKAYARALFSTFGFDAATVSPYLGKDSLEPFIKHRDKGIFILCRTSNRGARDFQDLALADGTPLYEIVARKASEWNCHGNIGLVVGATCPEELKRVRSICPEMPLLIPGIGAQGGDLDSVIAYGVDAAGEKAIITVSRQVIYASREKNFARAARTVAEQLRNQINSALPNHHLPGEQKE